MSSPNDNKPPPLPPVNEPGALQIGVCADPATGMVQIELETPATLICIDADTALAFGMALQECARRLIDPDAPITRN